MPGERIEEAVSALTARAEVAWGGMARGIKVGETTDGG